VKDQQIEADLHNISIKRKMAK